MHLKRIGGRTLNFDFFISSDREAVPGVIRVTMLRGAIFDFGPGPIAVEYDEAEAEVLSYESDADSTGTTAPEADKPGSVSISQPLDPGTGESVHRCDMTPDAGEQGA
jgi:hypothetical protein